MSSSLAEPCFVVLDVLVRGRQLCARSSLRNGGHRGDTMLALHRGCKVGTRRWRWKRRCQMKQSKWMRPNQPCESTKVPFHLHILMQCHHKNEWVPHDTQWWQPLDPIHSMATIWYRIGMLYGKKSLTFFFCNLSTNCNFESGCYHFMHNFNGSTTSLTFHQWVIAILKTEEYKIISQMLLAFKTWPRINRDKPRRYDN